MKNYLFAPFKNDDEKIEEFNAVIRGLNYEVSDVNPSLTDAEVNHYHESALHGLRIFIGRLESYYDNIISELKGEESVSMGWIEQLRAELNKEKEFAIETSIKNDKLQSENDALKDKLQGVNDDYNNDHKVHNEYEDGLLDEVKELKAEIKEKEEQYHMLASSKTSHYPKEYKAEAEEYFDHNPQCKKLLFFLIDGSEFDWDEDNDGMNGMNGEYHGCLFADDCIAEFDNTEGSE